MNDDTKQLRRIDSSKQRRDETVLRHHLAHRQAREMNDDTKQPRRIDSSKQWRDGTVLTGILIGVMAMVLFDLIVASIRHMP
jgi:hypothetical protein